MAASCRYLLGLLSGIELPPGPRARRLEWRNLLEHDLSGLETFTRENLSKDQRVAYAARGANWFVLSGSQGNKTFYQRYLLSHRQRIENSFQISYPSRLNVPYDPIVRRMSRSLRAGRGMDTEGNP
jgi:hypothetical protein